MSKKYEDLCEMNVKWEDNSLPQKTRLKTSDFMFC